MKGGENTVEIIFLSFRADGAVKFSQTMQNPAFKFWHLLIADLLSCRVIPVQRTQQITQCIPDTSVMISLAFDNF